MKKTIRSTLCLPGESGREVWSREGEGAWKKQPGTGVVEGGLFCVEAIALDSMPLWAVIPEGGRADVAAVASLRWEGLGLSEDAGGKSWAHWDGGEEGNRLLVASAGIAPEAPVAEWMKWKAEQFEISARVLPVPPGEAAVWCEMGRYVIAFHRSDRLVHFGVLAARALDESAAMEIRDLVRSLETQEFLTKLKGVRVWTASEPGFAEGLKTALEVRVVAEEKPAPVLPAIASGLLPPAVEAERLQRASRKKKAQVILALAAMYVAFFAAWSGWLFFREQTAARTERALAEKRPEVENIRQAHAHWLALEAATNPDTYPTEVFDRLVKLLPDQGIQFKEFTLDQAKLGIAGEASSFSHAKKFQTDVENSPTLKQFTWNFPQPTNLDDGRAKFQAQGAVNNAGGYAHEGQ